MPNIENATVQSRGATLARRLETGRNRAGRAPLPGARCLPVIRGLNPSVQTYSLLDNKLAEAGEILANTQRVFSYGNSVTLEIGDGEEARLVTLASDFRMRPVAPSLLANLFVCETDPTDKLPPKQFPPPDKLISMILGREPTLAAMPRVQVYARRPLFDQNYVLRGPGWHEDVGFLIHGIDIEPILPTRIRHSGSVLERLPPHLRRLLSDFCFKSDADIANAVAVLITGVLITHFTSSGKPLMLLDGNQRGVGKTLFVRMAGMVLDGEDPPVIHYTPEDEELQKRICANLRDGHSSQILIDNAKVKVGSAISSPVIEANSMAPEICLRILGKSENYRRPNDLLWYITMNDTKASPDLVSRGLPIRFYYEGDPKRREFQSRDPVEYARQYRQEILSELAGMVLYWNQMGRPQGQEPHRLTRWANVVGGVLAANGIPEGLSNLDEAASDFDSAMDSLSALVEAALGVPDGPIVRLDPEKGHVSNDKAGKKCAWPAGDWESLFRKAGIVVDKISAATGARGKATVVGNFLGTHIGQCIPVEGEKRCGTARLRKVAGRANQTKYYFELSTDNQNPANGRQS